MAGASAESPARARGGPWSAVLGWVLLYVGVATLGRLTVLPSAGVALFWPAAGVAALWLLLTPPQRLLLHATALYVTSVLVNLAFGADPAPALLFGVANLVQGLVTRGVLLLTRGEPVELRTPQDAWRLLIAAFLASVTSLPFGNLAAWLGTADWSVLTALAWLVRNSAGTFGAAALGIVLLTRPRGLVAGRGGPARLTTRRRRTAGLELVALLGTAAVTYSLVFGSLRALPIGFATVGLTVWVGQRFSPVVALSYAVGASMLVAGATTSGLGPLGAIEEPLLRALICQAFIVLSIMVALLLSLGSQERFRLIDELQTSRGAVRRQAELLDAVVERVEGGVLVLDEHGEVVMANDLARRFLAATSLSTVGGEVLERAEVMGTGPADLPREVLCRHPDGRQQVLEVSCELLPSPGQGSGAMHVITLLDVTRRLEREQELEGFAGVVAHDLQNPLTAVLSWAELLEDQLRDAPVDLERSRESLQRITRASERMSALVEDLLAYTRSHHSRLDLAPVRLSDLAASVARDVVEYADDRRVRIEVAQAPVTAEVDAVLLRQLLTNLLSNAVKYVPAGTEPHVRVSVDRDGDVARVTVSDNGIGIAEDERRRVFETFYRGGGGRRFSGTGLGLAICATVAQRHGGSLTVQPGPGGAGSTFVLVLPASSEATAEEGARGAAGPAPAGAPADAVAEPPRCSPEGAAGGLRPESGMRPA